MITSEKSVESLCDGDVILIAESEYPVRVHRCRSVSCFGESWIELIVSNTVCRALPLDDLLYQRGFKIKVVAK